MNLTNSPLGYFLKTFGMVLLLTLTGCGSNSPSNEINPILQSGGETTDSTPVLKYLCTDTDCFEVEIADTPAKWTRGLMGRSSLADKRGMFFTFPQSQFWSFFMRETFVSLDIFWIDSSGVIVDRALKTTPNDETPLLPSKPALYVLELAAGSAEKYQLNIGRVIGPELKLTP